MATKESDPSGSGGISRQNSGVGGQWESDLTAVQHSLKFVKNLEEHYVCPTCKGVVLNPHQTSCGHISCYRCIQGLLENSPATTSACLLDRGLIRSDEVRLRNHRFICVLYSELLLQSTEACQFESLQCSNTGCSEFLQRKDLQEHLRISCSYRMERCHYCTHSYTCCQLEVNEHERYTCPEVEINVIICMSLFGMSFLNMSRQFYCHTTNCYFSLCGQERRAQVKVHEETALNHHILLVLGSNTKLETQQEVLLRHKELQERSRQVSGLEEGVRPLAQLVSRCDNTLSAVQGSLEDQRDHISSVQLQLEELSSVFGPGVAREELGQIRASLDALRQQVSVTEGLKDHLGELKETYMRHSRLLSIHTAQLECNEEHFRELESTSYDGKLIWKLRDYRKKKEAGARGQGPCLSSVPFHTGRCGYKMAARAYLNGDGAGRDTHLSLYVVLMRGDFDPLLPWPFRQPVSLSVLDQSGTNNHLTMSFKPDPENTSFHRPGSAAANASAPTNVASGFQCFASHAQLETPKNAIYVRDDTLFVKVKVDTSGLEDL
uniref:TNF receptor-associated factor n=1 Tax=Oncorhynchus mykiss TaxID=8022 RepID=A0A8K9UPF4_ONCMY